MDEIWLVIDEFPDYEVSSLGRVRSLKWGRQAVLKPWRHQFGYEFVSLSVRGQKQQKRLIHSLVCKTFHGPKPSERHEVAHADGNPKNNTPDNLRWATPIENHADKRLHGTHFNDGQFKPVLSENDVREIRRLIGEERSQASIARIFGVSQSAISQIKLGHRWAHLK